MFGVQVTGGGDPVLASIHAGGSATVPTPPRADTMTAVMENPDMTSGSTQGDPAQGDAKGDASSSGSTGGAPIDTGPCAEQRRVVDERCELATRAREQATAAEDALRSAQRMYDDHEARADQAGRIADARAVRTAKDAAQLSFRGGRTTAHTTDEVEAAARSWLAEINRINAEAREMGVIAIQERESAQILGRDLERLGLEADAARINAGSADAACLAARQAVADCDESAAAAVVANEPSIHDGPPLGLFTDEQSPIGPPSMDRAPRIFRLLRGDRAAMSELVEAMAGSDPEARRRWQLAISDLVDAIVADSIAASALEFPTDDLFWSPFTVAQNRDIAGALASLGYRFDGLGGWVDGRVPSQRDLSLALGYAGLDPMRIRHWPTEAEMVVLYRDVAVAADEHLASSAGNLTLGELVTMLGRRADGLTELWNHWGRLRPLLLDED